MKVQHDAYFHFDRRWTTTSSVKTLTVALNPTDRCASEIVTMLKTAFPDIGEVEFREDKHASIPRAVRLIGASDKYDLARVDATLFKRFDKSNR